MKKILTIFLLIGLISCNDNSSASNSNDTFSSKHNLDWILGNWQRTNDKEGKVTFEHWKKISNREYVGIGITLQEKDMVFKENMKLIPIDGVWTLVVTGVNENPTHFSFTNQTKNSFVCENPNNEFPKKIEYQFSGKKLKAKVSAGEMEIAFDFEKINN